MAKKLSTAKKYERVEWQGFLERPLSDVELEELDGWKPDETEIWEMVEAVISDSYQIQLSFNTSTAMATCTLTDRDSTRKTAGYALSTKDENGALALKGMLYKHFTLLRADWKELVGAPKRGQRG